MSYPSKFLLTADQLRREYESGLLQREIAEKYGVTQTCVGQHMRRLGIPRRTKGFGAIDQRGSRNHQWKGDQASYKTFHNRLSQFRGKPMSCDVCGTSDPSKSYDWANLSGRFQDMYDYKRMCRSCHWKHDKKHLNLGQYSTKGHRWTRKSKMK